MRGGGQEEEEGGGGEEEEGGERKEAGGRGGEEEEGEEGRKEGAGRKRKSFPAFFPGAGGKSSSPVEEGAGKRGVWGGWAGACFLGGASRFPFRYAKSFLSLFFFLLLPGLFPS